MNSFDREYLIDFGKNFAKIRKQKGMTQEQLAYKSNISLSQIARLETGVLNTSIITLKILSENLEIEIWQLFKF